MSSTLYQISQKKLCRMNHITQQIILSQASQQKICLESVLTCLLCHQYVKKAQICPTCSKLFCESCLRSWLHNNDYKCPNCSQQLTKDKVVSCHKLSQQLMLTLNRLNKGRLNESDLCQTHMIKNSYYCSTCLKSVCSDCCILSTNHTGHKLSKLKLITGQFDVKLNKFRNIIGMVKMKLEKYKQNYYQNQLEQINSKNIKIKQLENHMRRITDQIKQKFHLSIQQLQNNIQIGNQHIKQFSHTHQNILNQLINSPKALFISKKSIIIQQSITKALNLCFKDNQQISIINSQKYPKQKQQWFQSQLIPKYQKKTFIFNNYSLIRQKKQCIYSQSFFTCGLQWRLKIYPNGNNEQQNGLDQKYKDRRFRNQGIKSPKNQSYLSIYIQLKNGLQKVAKYRHKIVIQNQLNPCLKISRQFQSQFQSGQCWGYNHFARIQTLYDDSYVHCKEDYLQITLYVGPPTYYCASLDQQCIINSKLQIIQKNQQIINQLIKSLDSSKINFNPSKTELSLLKTNNSCNSSNLISQEYTQTKQYDCSIKKIQLPNEKI